MQGLVEAATKVVAVLEINHDDIYNKVRRVQKEHKAAVNACGTVSPETSESLAMANDANDDDREGLVMLAPVSWSLTATTMDNDSPDTATTTCLNKGISYKGQEVLDLLCQNYLTYGRLVELKVGAQVGVGIGDVVVGVLIAVQGHRAGCPHPPPQSGWHPCDYCRPCQGSCQTTHPRRHHRCQSRRPPPPSLTTTRRPPRLPPRCNRRAPPG